MTQFYYLDERLIVRNTVSPSVWEIKKNAVRLEQAVLGFNPLDAIEAARFVLLARTPIEMLGER